MFVADSIEKLYETANTELLKIKDWLHSNQLSVNAKKSKYILHSHHTGKVPSLFLGEEIDRVGEKFNDKSHKILGVWVDEHLSFKHHIDAIYKKIQTIIAIMIRSKFFLPMRIKMLIYNGLILSRLTYCCTIFGGTNGSHIEKLNKLQRKALRMIAMESYVAHCDPIFYQLRTLKLEHLVELNYLKSGHNLFHNKEPEPISEMFQYAEDTNTRSSGHSRLVVPKCRVDSIKSFTKYKIPVAWNAAIDITEIKLKGKMPSLINSYKQWRLMEYSKFECKDKNCYSCLMS